MHDLHSCTSVNVTFDPGPISISISASAVMTPSAVDNFVCAHGSHMTGLYYLLHADKGPASMGEMSSTRTRSLTQSSYMCNDMHTAIL